LKLLSAEFVTSAVAGEVPRDGLPQIAFVGRSNVGKSSLINALARTKIARTSAAPGKTRLANVYRVALEAGPGGPGRWSVYLVDLPGFGYARGGASAASELAGVAERYFTRERPRPERHAGVPNAAADLRWPTGGNRHAAAPPRGSERQPSAAAERESATGHAPGVGTQREQRKRGPGTPTMVFLLVDSRHPELESDVEAAGWLSSLGVETRIVATKIDKLTRAERARNLKTLETTYGTAATPVSALSGEGLDDLWQMIATLARKR
jgi:GTP-binding protein